MPDLVDDAVDGVDLVQPERRVRGGREVDPAEVTGADPHEHPGREDHEVHVAHVVGAGDVFEDDRHPVRGVPGAHQGSAQPAQQVEHRVCHGDRLLGRRGRGLARFG